MTTTSSLIDTLYVVSDTKVAGFFREHRFLSNFEMVEMDIEGIVYPSSEHAYMAQKTLDVEQRILISKEPTAGKARRVGQTIPLRVDWEVYKVAAMMHVLRAKFKNPTMRELLLNTGTRYLEETNWWQDRYWGVCDNIGLNMLGKCLMLVRTEIRDGY